MEVARKAFVSSDMAHDEALFDIADSHPVAVMMWPWIITYLDDWGRAMASPKRIKSQLFPNLPVVTVEVIEEAIEAYASVGLLEWYTDEHHDYIAIPLDKWFSWQTHIRSDKRENDRSKYPPCPADWDKLREGECKVRAIARGFAQVRADRDPSPSLSLSLTPTREKEKDKDSDSLPLSADEEIAVIREIDVQVQMTSLSSDLDPGLAQVAKAYESEGFGMITPSTSEQLIEFVRDYGANWTLMALKEAVAQGKRRLKYVRGVLQNWKADGGPRLSDEPSQRARAPATAIGAERDQRYAAFYQLFPDS